MSIQPCDEAECSEGSGAVALVVRPREKDLGGFSVRRALPSIERRRIGPFVFFDHMGPATLPAGPGLSVRPHPHIGLETVTYLFEGTIRHQDSLGFDQEIEPGAVNWMTAGRGIAHSERTPTALTETGSRLSGFQAWVALPKADEERAPAFVHHPAETIPLVERDGFALRLIAGDAYGQHSPVETGAPLLYLAGEARNGGALALPDAPEERAVYVGEGEASVDDVALPAGTLAVLAPGADATLTIHADAKLAIFGGPPLDGDRHLWWNFVSSSAERIEQAKRDWKEGRFDAVPGDDEFIPLPEA